MSDNYNLVDYTLTLHLLYKIDNKYMKEKIGRKGRLVFVYCRYEFVNQNDALVVTGMRSVIQIYN